MTKKKPHLTFALVDKAGKTRGTCEATSSAAAAILFRVQRQRQGRQDNKIPEGWKIVLRTPLKSEPKKVAPKAKPAPKLIVDGSIATQKTKAFAAPTNADHARRIAKETAKAPEDHILTLTFKRGPGKRGPGVVISVGKLGGATSSAAEGGLIATYLLRLANEIAVSIWTPKK